MSDIPHLQFKPILIRQLTGKERKKQRRRHMKGRTQWARLQTLRRPGSLIGKMLPGETIGQAMDRLKL